MKKTLEMTFRSNGGKEIVISVANPKDTITKAAVDAVMADIINRNLFITASGDLVQAVEAQIRVVDVATLS